MTGKGVTEGAKASKASKPAAKKTSRYEVAYLVCSGLTVLMTLVLIWIIITPEIPARYTIAALVAIVASASFAATARGLWNDERLPPFPRPDRTRSTRDVEPDGWESDD